MIKKIPVIKCVRERSVSYEHDEGISSPQMLARIAHATIGNEDREHFLVIHLNAKHKVISTEIVSVGSLSACLVHPREVFKGAIVAGASVVGLAHNHPSGDTTPSPEDIALTKQLIQAGEILGIKVIDHVIVGDPFKHTSIRETNFHLGFS